jgi:Na+/phosphate symporter
MVDIPVKRGRRRANDVLKMSSLTDRIFKSAVEGLLNRNSELCDHVVAEDDELDTLEETSRSRWVKRVDSLSVSRGGHESSYFREYRRRFFLAR